MPSYVHIWTDKLDQNVQFLGFMIFILTLDVTHLNW